MNTEIISKLITWVKKSEFDYKIDKNISKYDLFKIVWLRVFQYLRGIRVRFKIKSSGLIFAGKKIIIRHGNKVTAGNSFIIGDCVYIDGLSKNGIKIGDNVTILNNASLVTTGVIRNLGIGITIGDDSSVGAFNFISGQGGIRIGDHVIMGPYVKIFSENHRFSDPDLPIKYQGEERKEVVIGDNCWIGAGSTILAGVKISEGTVVAANSVVTKNINEKNKIVAGTPAKIIKSRF